MIEIADIKTSIENPRLIKDNHARNGIFKKDKRDRLISYSGGFSVVFPYEAEGKTWAFRCWHVELSNIKERYTKIGKDISKSRLPFFCEFEFVEHGICVNGTIYPITRMRWIDGDNIKNYICSNANNKVALLNLADKFMTMCHDMHEHHFAHGDLQHGNILVDKSGNLFLVDYDSMSTPSVFGQSDEIVGLKDYQHPKRNASGVLNEKLDYFSELIIYISILAIAENSSLADKYNVEDADRMLFEATDFLDLKNSKIWNDLKLLKNNTINKLLSILQEYLEHDSINELEPFEAILYKPEITIKLDKHKVRQDSNEIVTIKWNIKRGLDSQLFINGKAENINEIGEKCIPCDITTTFEIMTISNYNKKAISKSVTVNAYPQSQVDFSIDKKYSLPEVPIKLMWNVTHANKVVLEGYGKVDFCSSKVLEPTKNTVYKLKVEDEFGEFVYTQKVTMLPLPQIKTLLVPTPKLEQHLGVYVVQPRLDVQLKMPQIEMRGIELSLPKTMPMMNVELSKELFPPMKSLGIVSRITILFKKYYNNKD